MTNQLRNDISYLPKKPYAIIDQSSLDKFSITSKEITLIYIIA